MCVHLLQSKNCRLANLPPKALVRHKEEAQEFGGTSLSMATREL